MEPNRLCQAGSMLMCSMARGKRLSGDADSARKRFGEGPGGCRVMRHFLGKLCAGKGGNEIGMCAEGGSTGGIGFL
jgi:hypothetical protein